MALERLGLPQFYVIVGRICAMKMCHCENCFVSLILHPFKVPSQTHTYAYAYIVDMHVCVLIHII